MAALTFPDLTTPSGLKHLDHHLSSQTYISGSQASKDDISVYCSIPESPGPDLPNASRWYHHITSLIGSRFPGTPVGVKIEKSPSMALSRELPDEVPLPETPAPATDNSAQAEDDDDLDLFGDETEEEKKAAEEREKSKPASKKKESGKSSVLLEVKPWDDETDLVKLEEAVRSVSMPGLFWGASKLVPVAFNIKKLQIMMTVEDDLVSVDNLIEDYFLEEPRNEYIQSCDIIAFNKI